MLDAKTLAVFLPFLAAILYGLSYALSEKILVYTSITTFFLIGDIVSTIVIVLMHMFTSSKIDFSFIKFDVQSRMIFLTSLLFLLAGLITTVAIKNVSANYAAIGEISYPLFTVLFCYLLYGHALDWSTAIGAALIMAGSFMIVKHNI